MAFYIKVTKQVADQLQLTAIRNKTADGNVLLWQADVARFSGDTVFDHAASVGGVCLSPQEAKTEIDGTENPVQVSTPDEYKEDNAGEADATASIPEAEEGEEVRDERSE